MLSAFKNFFVTFLIAALVFGAGAYFAAQFLTDTITGIFDAEASELDEILNPSQNPTPSVTEPVDPSAGTQTPAEELEGGNSMNNKVTIIGAGSVGATVAYTLVAMGSVSEIVLIDVKESKAQGEALDIKQATPYLSPVKIYSGTYEDAAGSDIVIITSGVGRKPGQSRIDLTQTNVNILKEIAPNIVKYVPDALYLLVANPVDVLVYVFCQLTGVPKNRVIGTGTTLDSIRLRTRLSELYSVNQKQVHAYVLGEHGDSSFVAWSTADISGIPLSEYENTITDKSDVKVTPYVREEVEQYVKKSGGQIIAGKGATFYGIAACVAQIVNSIYSQRGQQYATRTKQSLPPVGKGFR